MSFGEKLTEARKEKGLSQEGLAKQIFVTRQALSRWENNTAQPSLEMLSVLCNILDKSPSFFIDGKVQPPRNYKTLARSEKRSLWEEWRPNNAHYGLKCCFFQLLLCVGIFLLTLTICNCYVNGLWNFYEAGKPLMIIGAVLWILAAVLMSIFNSLNTSARYNLWLLKTHSIVRANKFYSI